MKKLKILLFYDNFVRDFRGLLLLREILMQSGCCVWLAPLWKNPKEKIQYLNPDTVLLGQVGEYATSRIALFCYQLGVNLVLNTTEFIDPLNKLEKFFLFNQEYPNDKIVDFQVLPNRIFANFVENNRKIKNKKKYKLLGVPRFDIISHPVSRSVEADYVRKKYQLRQYKKVFLYISSFIFDETGGEIDPRNISSQERNKIYEEELKEKKAATKILLRLVRDFRASNYALLIKKHPWDKSSYFEDNFQGKNVIVVDKFERATPLIGVCDYFLHGQSTAALEAWIQNKKTISILPFFDGKRKKLKYHMKDEIIVRSYEELINRIKRYPLPVPGKESLKIFEPFLDGKATARLAKEIIKLRVKENKVIFSKRERIRAFIAWEWERLQIKKHPYALHLSSFEKEKPKVESMYRKAIREIIKQQKVK